MSISDDHLVDPDQYDYAITDYRALCAELVDALHEKTCLYEGYASPLVIHARTALSTPQQGAPSDNQILACLSWSSHCHTFASDLVDFGRQVLARYGAQVVPLPETQP